MKPGTAHLGLVTDPGHVEVGDHLVGDLARGTAEALGQRECDVGLEVGELAGSQHRVGVGVLLAECRRQGGLDQNL